ncbi:MAG: hypothetical protein Q8Q42_00360 [Nanoarchaeota archaeon]|nr:hypothetical protein [Nanoarchaeota archaeon]
MENDNVSDEAIAKTQSKIGIWMVVLFLALALFVFFMIKSQGENIDKLYFEYNGITFAPSKTGVGYDMQFFINDAQYPVIMNLRNDPRELEDIPIDIDKVKNMIIGKSQIYITINATANLTGRTTIAAKEIDYFIDNPYLYDIPVNSAFLAPTTEAGPKIDKQVIKTCEDSNENVTVIWLRLGDETAVFEEDGCVIVQGKTPDEMEIIRAADRLYLTMMGIMN